MNKRCRWCVGIGLGWTHRQLAHPAPPAPSDIGAGLAAIDDIHVAGDKVDTHQQGERVCRKGASFTCVDSNMSAAKNIVKALEPFTR